MNRYTLCAILLLLAIGCKKKTDPDGQTTPYNPCPANVYGYKAVSTYMGITDTSSSTFGIINLTSNSIASLGSIMASTSASNGAWDPFNNCYYTFHSENNYAGADKLYKISVNGALSTFVPANANDAGAELVYNKIARKLFCISRQQLAEINIIDSTYTITPVGLPFSGKPGTLTVDNNTGDFYYYLYDTITRASSVHYWSIVKYAAGTSAVVTIYNDSSSNSSMPALIGLRHNISDNKLYAMKEYSGTYRFVRIHPSTGSVDSLYEQGFVNYQAYSACIDACSNTYIFSHGNSDLSNPVSSLFYLKQLSTTGELLHSHISNYIFQGLVSTY